MCGTADSKRKITLGLALLAYDGDEQQLSREKMNQCLKQYQDWLGKLTTVWGPAYHLTNKSAIMIPALKKAPQLDSMAFMVQDQEHPGDYYLAIRGTNPENLAEWIFQDFWVGNTVAWDKVPYEETTPPPESSPDIPAISFGTNIALTILMNLRDELSGKKIAAFLQDLVNSRDESAQKISLYITGHSLGGVLASTFHLLLHEKWQSLETSRSKPDFYSYAYAGPTAGNQQFAERFKLLGEFSKRFANNLDVATKVWNPVDMQMLPALYHQAGISMPGLMAKLLNDIAIPAIQNKGYTQIETWQEIPSQIVPSFNHYLAQMIYQHLIPYISDFLRECPQSNKQRLIKLIESWEIFTSFKNSEPLSAHKNKNLQYYFDFLTGC
ncbi:MAG TPA: hypothetical protein DDW65_04075 [Firmicutes bacterium]|jgi:hypothetical protein|nr:hypothetical protein [Bacillota bacterium]